MISETDPQQWTVSFLVLGPVSLETRIRKGPLQKTDERVTDRTTETFGRPRTERVIRKKPSEWTPTRDSTIRRGQGEDNRRIGGGSREVLRVDKRWTQQVIL